MTDLWQPSAAIEILRLRAQFLEKIRYFFSERGVLEVETPLLCQHGVTDPHMPLMTSTAVDGRQPFYLQSSPEYAMKRLLAAGSGPIFQLCKAFRRSELGSRHNPEFTMLEWYRPGFDEGQLMTEIAELLQQCLGLPASQRISYRDVFQQYLQLDPHTASLELLIKTARHHINLQMQSDDRNDWLNLLMAEVIEPQLGHQSPLFIVDYPASQAALAQTAQDEQGQSIAKRFELYIQGVELANGYLELTDADALAQRFSQEQQQREALGVEPMLADSYLLSAMRSGMPACAGVALGFDRLMMIACQAAHIREVISFDSERA